MKGDEPKPKTRTKKYVLRQEAPIDCPLVKKFAMQVESSMKIRGWVLGGEGQTDQNLGENEHGKMSKGCMQALIESAEEEKRRQKV